MATANKLCATGPDCGIELPAGHLSPFCRNCRGHFYRWKKRRPAERLERSRKLRLYSARMEELLDQGNVVELRGQRKKA